MMNQKTGNILLFLTLIITLVMTGGCSTRGINNDYDGATAQRLVTHSLDKLASLLPKKDFLPFANRKIYAKCHFIQKDHHLCAYAAERIRMELLHTYSCLLADREEEAEAIFDFFFTAIGTNREKAGFSTPDLVLPGFGGMTSIDLITLDMFHGVSELYYYIRTKADHQISRSKKVKAIIRTDSLGLPIITIPVNSLR